jgi:hypothetical protein
MIAYMPKGGMRHPRTRFSGLLMNFFVFISVNPVCLGSAAPDPGCQSSLGARDCTSGQIVFPPFSHCKMLKSCAVLAALSWWRRQFSHVDRRRRKALQIAFAGGAYVVP